MVASMENILKNLGKHMCLRLDQFEHPKTEIKTFHSLSIRRIESPVYINSNLSYDRVARVRFRTRYDVITDNSLWLRGCAKENSMSEPGDYADAANTTKFRSSRSVQSRQAIGYMNMNFHGEKR